MTSGSPHTDIPIFVDLDGTLVKTDLAQEQLAGLVFRPAHLGGLIRTGGEGRSHLKRYVAENARLDVALLPYNDEVLDYLTAEKAAGRRIILATAADSKVAEAVAGYLEIFDDIIASTPGNNLKGAAKLAEIEASAEGPFEYLGDSPADLPIWQAADRVGFVNAAHGLRTQVPNEKTISLAVDNKPPVWKSLLKAMRPHQWVKNALIFLPLFFSHSYGDPELLVRALLTFVAFSLLASSVYLFNDIQDLGADRRHASKKFRPFAAGTLSPVKGLMAAGGLMVFALGLSALTLGAPITLLLLIYLAITFLYSGWLKHFSTIDVITLTCLYTMRIFVGGVAIGALPSPWLLNFSLFFFLSLALMKRYVELDGVRAAGKDRSRGYQVGDLPAVMAGGISTGGLSVLTLTLYLNSDFVAQTYQTPMLLWLVAPLILFWIQRAWVWALRGWIHSDPVVFALRDRISRVTLGLTCLLVVAAKYLDLGAWFQ
ncbi:UbiA family prenyltransferase [Shimia sp. SDUM112013]|uniref:UbiA family prenyltransferase n=1 Tax=Shimia sp. SDUM112013 TaxID=3136160 RepID=UPI0032EDB5A2